LDEQETAYQLRIMSEETEKKTGLDLKPAQIAAGALAAVTAAFLGSKLNVAGTIAGAAVASVVSTIGSALYQSSIERTRASVRRVGSKAWVVKPATGQTDAEAVAEAAGKIDEDKVHTAPATEVDVEDKSRETRRWPRIAAGALLVFVLGMLAVTGVEWVRGAPLSGGSEGTSLGAVVGKPTGPESEAPPPTTTSTPDAPSATAPPPSTTSAPPSTTTGSSPSSTSAQPSTTAPSTTGQTSSAPPAQTTPNPPESVGTPG
jgi:hypothetical protein